MLVAIIDKNACRILNLDENGEFLPEVQQIEDMKKQINGVALKQSEFLDL